MTTLYNRITKLTMAAVTVAILSACTADVSNPPPLNSGTPSAGDADFSKFVAIGDSLTAGYADGALYLLGQQNSFPSILGKQFADVGGGSFTQPLITDPATSTAAQVAEANLGGLLVGGVSGVIENRFVLNTETESPERLADIAGSTKFDVVGTGLNGTAFNNTGVPGAKSFHLVTPNYGDAAGLAGGTANPYFVRFSSAPAATVIADAVAQIPSFVTLWIGNNDVLSYATSGGIGVDQTGNANPATYGPNDITDPTAFAGVYTQLVAAIKAANSAVKGVLINIPDVSTIPFFTTVPYNPVPLDQATADKLNTAYAAYNGGLAAAQGLGLITADEVAQRTISFSAGQNAVVILDEDLTDITAVDPGLINMRQATASDLIVLPAGGFIGTENPNSAGTTPPAGMPWGLGTPLTDADVLIPSEIAAIDTARSAFNATIKAAADADPNLVLFDASAMLTELKTSGIDFGTGSITSDFATGGGFSLDGVHPTARGYAVVANAIIDVINSGFNANVHKVDPATYSTVFLK